MGGSLGVHRAAASREPDGEEELVLRRPVFDVLSLEPFIPFRLLAVVIKAGSGAELAQPVVADPLETNLEPSAFSSSALRRRRERRGKVRGDVDEEARRGRAQGEDGGRRRRRSRRRE